MGEHDVAVPFGQEKFMEEPRHTAARTTTNPPAANSTGTVATSPPAAPANTTTRTTSTDTHRGYPDHAEVSMTKDQLKAMPEVRYSRQRVTRRGRRLLSFRPRPNTSPRYDNWL